MFIVHRLIMISFIAMQLVDTNLSAALRFVKFLPRVLGQRSLHAGRALPARVLREVLPSVKASKPRWNVQLTEEVKNLHVISNNIDRCSFDKSSLQSIKLEDCEIADEALAQMIQSSSQLKTLEVKKCILKLPIICSKTLTDIYFVDCTLDVVTINFMFRACPYLKKVTLNNCKLLNSKNKELEIGHRTLQSLSLDGCLIKNHAVNFLLLNCIELRLLSLEGCLGVEGSLVNHKKLAELDLRGTGITKSCRTVPDVKTLCGDLKKKFPHLKTLYISSNNPYLYQGLIDPIAKHYNLKIILGYHDWVI